MENDRDTKAKITPSYFAHMMKVHSDTFTRNFGMQIKKHSHTKALMYSFELPSGEAAREEAA